MMKRSAYLARAWMVGAIVVVLAAACSDGNSHPSGTTPPQPTSTGITGLLVVNHTVSASAAAAVGRARRRDLV